MLLAGYGGAAFKEDGRCNQILLFDTTERLAELQEDK